MGAALPILMGAQAIGGISKSIAEGEEGRAAEGYYKYLAGNARTSADLAEAAGDVNAEQIGAQGASEQSALSRKIRATVGAQKAALASGGAGVGSKTGEQLVADTLDKGNLDEMALDYNTALKIKNARLGAKMTAFNERTQAEGYEMAGKNARRASKMNQFSTLLGTASNVASTYYAGKKAKGG